MEHEVKSERRHETEWRDGVAFAGAWAQPQESYHCCDVPELSVTDGDTVLEVAVDRGDDEPFVEVRNAGRVLFDVEPSATRVLAAVLLEAAEIAETGVVPGEVRS